MKRIFCIHLFNDYSGSPLVFSTVIKGLQKKEYECSIFTCSGQEGFLSGMSIPYHYFYYRWLPNRWLRLFMYVYSQWSLFNKVKAAAENADIIYINTLLPFGAALAGWKTDTRVVYHIHEVSIKPALLKRFLRWVAAKTANQVIFVSQFLAEEEALPGVPFKVVPNALSGKFVEAVNESVQQVERSAIFKVLMLCSLRAYKGVDVFVEIARDLPDLDFDLVLNASEEEIARYFSGTQLPVNLTMYPKQKNVHPFYQKADLVLNLSHPEQWKETFGMTLLEAMYYGLPCIAPPVGGPAEIIVDGEEGFLIDQRDKTKINTTIRRLSVDKVMYQEMSKKAQAKAQSFSEQQLISDVDTVLNPEILADQTSKPNSVF